MCPVGSATWKGGSEGRDSSICLGPPLLEVANAVEVWAHYCYKHAQGFTYGSNRDAGTSSGPGLRCQRRNGSRVWACCCPNYAQGFNCGSKKERQSGTEIQGQPKASFSEENYLKSSIL